MSTKRRRTDGASNPRMRGAAIGARYAKKYPYSQFGTQRFAKGSMVDLAGASYAQASAEQKAWRRANNYYGVGGFWGDLYGKAKGFVKKNWKKGAGMALKHFVPGGEAAATALGLGRYDMGGVGSYGPIGQNAIVHGGGGDSMAIANVNPSMTDDSGDVILSHSEFIGNVVASVILPAGGGTLQSTFQNSAYAINPGLQQTFPFLCQLAQNFTMYKLEGVIYQYKPTSGEGGGSTNALGKVIMATDYDPMALPFINSVQMENYQYSQSTKPSLAARHGVECATAQGITEMKYVRTGTSNRDKSFTDYGLFQIATEGIPITGTVEGVCNSNIGELWVSYRVRLSRANLYTSLLGYSIRNDVYDYYFPTQAQGVYAVPTVTYPGTYNNMGTTVTAWSGATTTGMDQVTIRWPVSQILGVYKITIHSKFTIGEANNMGWVPEVSSTSYNANGDRTQWGCPFTATRNYQNLARTIPNVNLSTGVPIVLDTSINGLSKLCYVMSSEAADTLAPIETVTSLYFAINAPTTTIATLVLGLRLINAAGQAGAAAWGFFTGASGTDMKIFIEQVNAEISNA